MKHIHPISEDSCREHYGKPVLIILKDGSELVGILTRFDQDKIIINGETFNDNVSSSTTTTNTVVKKTKKISVNSNKKKSRGDAVVSAFPGTFGVSPFGGGLVLDLALIALLFALI